MTRPPYIVVASLLKRDAMCALFFTHLQSRAPLRIVQFGSDPLAAPLAGASALVVIRGLFEFGNLLDCARRLGVPRYYFLDDNFMLIREEAKQYGPSYDLYTNDRVRRVLTQFSGVLLAAGPLIDYFREHQLHPRTMYYPPVAGPVLATPSAATSRPLTVAFFGGAHRREPFRRLVYPALRRVAATRPVRILAAGIARTDLPDDPTIEVRALPYDRSYEEALRVVAVIGADILVHPSDTSAHNIFKNPHVLINARAIGATPIFSDAPPYRQAESDGVALVAGDTEEAWYAALEKLAADPRRRASINARLSEYCDQHFGGERNVAILDDILANHPRSAWPPAAAKLAVAGACLTAGRIQRKITSLLSSAST